MRKSPLSSPFARYIGTACCPSDVVSGHNLATQNRVESVVKAVCFERGWTSVSEAVFWTGLKHSHNKPYDFMIDIGSHVFVIEVDEEAHFTRKKRAQDVKWTAQCPISMLRISHVDDQLNLTRQKIINFADKIAMTDGEKCISMEGEVYESHVSGLRDSRIKDKFVRREITKVRATTHNGIRVTRELDVDLEEEPRVDFPDVSPDRARRVEFIMKKYNRN